MTAPAPVWSTASAKRMNLMDQASFLIAKRDKLSALLSQLEERLKPFVINQTSATSLRPTENSGAPSSPMGVTLHELSAGIDALAERVQYLIDNLEA